jgi:hypothetical protein
MRIGDPSPGGVVALPFSSLLPPLFSIAVGWLMAGSGDRVGEKGGTIGDREKEGRGAKSRETRKIKGKIVYGREERVYIVARIPRW